jgi:hypothetical protein
MLLEPATVLSRKLGLAGRQGDEDVPKEDGAAGQARAGVPATARQVAKRSALVWR